MTSYVSPRLRRLVRARSFGVCEYCLIHEDDTFFGCHVGHVISEKHGGATESDNLAYACAVCNRNKGTDLGSIAPGTMALIRFYNPRVDRWRAHFELAGPRIMPRTKAAEVTENILGMNRLDRTLERIALIEAGRYPSDAARRLLDRGPSLA